MTSSTIPQIPQLTGTLHFSEVIDSLSTNDANAIIAQSDAAFAGYEVVCYLDRRDTLVHGLSQVELSAFECQLVNSLLSELSA